MKKNKQQLEEDLFDDTETVDEEEASDTSKLFLGLTDEEILSRIEIEYTNAYEFRKPQIVEWHENENLLYGKKPKTLSKRSNIMVQLMAGFEDTLLSKIKQPIYVVYTPTENADVIRARKVTNAWQLESSVSHEDWEYKDLLVKKLAMISGRGILKVYASYPYSHRLDPIDHYDFLIDPMANGMSIESARYLGQDNIIKSKYDLEEGSYDQEKVKELINSYAENNTEKPDNIDQQKSNRFAVVGLNYSDFFQAGDSSYKLLEWYTTIKGARCVFLLDRSKKIIVKKNKLEEITGELEREGKPFWPYESWAYYPDLFNFWSPAPMSRVRELFILRNISLNEMFDNNEAKNRPMRAYDPKVYTNPALLSFQADRLIPVASGREPERALYTLPVNDIIEPQQFQKILEDLTGKITGVTASGAGLSDTEKVGIYYGDQQEVEKRMTLFEISYNRCHLKLGQKYLIYLSERLDEKSSIKILGEDGAEYEDLTQDDLAEFDITLTGGLSQATNDALEKKQKNEFLTAQLQNPVFNKKFQLELGMALNGFSQDDIKRALSPIDVDEKQSIRASQDIQKILQDIKFRPFLKAEVTYMQKIFDYVYETELPKEQEDKILAYLQIVQPIVLKNMINKARSAMALKGMLKVPEEFANDQAQVPTAGTEPSPENPNNPLLNSQQGLDQQRVQEIPAESQASYERS
jgi:hypothetical protein